MALYEDLTAQQKQDEDEQKKSVIDNAESSNKHKINIKKELIAMNGKSYPSQKVFVEALKYLKTEAQKYFRKLKVGKPKDSEIQWILTVPAIWNDYAKNQMREWAISAGLVHRDIENQLKIVFEP